ncbi:MAG TPA: type II and III secretion system protein, partial [Burkholderiales bacterium]|nr:type II and III secretion system protein [Burkholderiales bacterium]
MLRIFAAIMGLILAACATRPLKPSPEHMTARPERQGTIPSPVRESVILPPPKPAGKMAVYSVSVYSVPVQELLYALARDAHVNIDVHPGINGVVTLNAIDQTLPQILSRISDEVDMRYEREGAAIIVMPDTPYLLTYKVDYLDMERDTNGSVAIITQVATPGAGITATGGSTASTGINNSTTSVANVAKNRFWETLVQNIKDILHETDKILPAGSSETVVEQAGLQTTTGTGANPPKPSKGTHPSLATSPNPATLQNTGTTVIKRTTFREASSVIANPETGIISIRATSRQHRKIQEFLDEVMQSAKRQVLIEAT